MRMTEYFFKKNNDDDHVQNTAARDLTLTGLRQSLGMFKNKHQKNARQRDSEPLVGMPMTLILKI